MASATLARRLPGVRFEVQSQPPANALPPMDVAMFVGFATSGPLHTPVAVEDPVQFNAIFGDDARLAWDPERGEPVYAYLAPAVRSFFRQGGRRCWVVRVARDTARSNYFPIPGLVRVSGGGLVVTPALAQARSKGSWSDTLQVGAALVSRLVGISWDPVTFPILDLQSDVPAEVAPGDLLRLTFDEGYMALLPIQSVQSMNVGSPPNSGSSLLATTGTDLWFKTQPGASPLASPQDATLIAPGGDGTTSRLTLPVLDWSLSDPVALTLEISTAFVLPGSLVTVDWGEEQLWLSVQDVSAAQDAGSPPTAATRVTGQGLWKIPPPYPLPTSSPTVELLTFDLYAQMGTGQPVRLTDLGFQPSHARFWGALPTDEEFFRATLDSTTSRYPDLWQAATDPLFPFAGSGPEDGFFFLPLAMPEASDQLFSAVPSPDVALARDGLDQFSAAPFLDPRLSDVGSATLLADANFLRYQSQDPAHPYLTGMHATLDVEEASIIAVPDAVHRGWYRSGAGEVLPPTPGMMVAHPDWRHVSADASSTAPAATEPEWASFLHCGVRVIPPPNLQLVSGPDDRGTFTLMWSGPTGLTGHSVVEEATDPSFADAALISSGPADRITIYGRAPGDYYYHARFEVNGESSDWSSGLGVRVAAGDSWYLAPPAAYEEEALLSIQRALLRLCAARGDMTAMFALPEHYRADDALQYVVRLKSPVDLLSGSGTVRPLDSSETGSFSYAAVYHPWLVVAEPSGSGQAGRRMPPDGALCGILAARTLTRDAWISPANQPIEPVLAISSPVPSWRRADLQVGQINLIWHEPHGFVSLGADTLSADPALRPLNVRRLLILLRRMALHLAGNYVFEPNDDAFQRLVQRGLEGMLQQLFIRGAFAGTVPATAFQVVADSSVNSQANLDAGRFVVDIKVAPSLPLSFLTIRLVQTDNGATVLAGG